MIEIPHLATCRHCGKQIERWSESHRWWKHSDTGQVSCAFEAEPIWAAALEGDDVETTQAIPVPLYYGETTVTAIRTEDRQEGWRVTMGTAEGLGLWFEQTGGFDRIHGLDFHLDELGTIRRGDVLTITIGRKQS